MTRDEFYRMGLPVADAMLQSQVEMPDPDDQIGGEQTNSVWKRGGVPHNLGIIGPTAAEVADLMPMTDATVDSCGGWFSEPQLNDQGQIGKPHLQPAVFPVTESTDLNNLLEATWYWQWCDDWLPPMVFLALPPEVTFSDQFDWPDQASLYEELKDLRDPDRESSLVADLFGGIDRTRRLKEDWNAFRALINRSTSPTLTLASLLHPRAFVWSLLPDEDLASGSSGKLRSWARKEVFRREVNIGKAWDAGEASVVVGDDDDDLQADDWAVARLACWRSWPEPYLPNAIWAFNAHGCESRGGSESLALAGFRDSQCMPYEPLHYRRRLVGQWRKAALTTDYWQQMLVVASGNGARSEDDRFLLRDHLQTNPAECWSANADDPTDQPMWSSGESLGYPIRTVAEVCRRVVHARQLTEEGFGSGRLVVPLRGKGGGAVLSEWTWLDRSRAISEVSEDDPERVREDPARNVILEALVLACEDADFLYRQLTDSRDFILSKSMGSLQEPIVPRHVVEKLKIFWPPTDQRRAIAEAIESTSRCSQDEAEHMRAEIEQLRVDIASLFRQTDNEDSDESPSLSEPPSPLLYAQWWNTVRERYMDIGRRLEAAAGTFWSKDLRRPPVTIGFLKRRRESSAERAEKAKLALELGDTLLRHHAFLGIALLQATNPSRCGDFLREWLANGSTWNGSMGHWREAATRTAKALSAASDEVPRAIRPIMDEFLAVKPNQFDSLASRIINLRNEAHAHGFTPTGPSAEALDSKADHIVAELDGLLGYLTTSHLVQVDGRRRRPKETILEVRYLTGENELVERSTISTDEPSANSAYDGLVHVLTGYQWNMLPMHPWLTYRSEGPGDQECPWLFDGFDANHVRYRSPMRPGTTLEISDARQELQDLMEN